MISLWLKSNFQKNSSKQKYMCYYVTYAVCTYFSTLTNVSKYVLSYLKKNWSTENFNILLLKMIYDINEINFEKIFGISNNFQISVPVYYLFLYTNAVSTQFELLRYYVCTHIKFYFQTQNICFILIKSQNHNINNSSGQMKHLTTFNFQ